MPVRDFWDREANGCRRGDGGKGREEPEDHEPAEESSSAASTASNSGGCGLSGHRVAHGDELSLTDLAERAGLAYPTAHREVARLIDAGILSERRVGRTRLIRASGESPLVEPLREILRVVTGPVVILAEELARIDGIEAAFLYGSFAARLLGDAGPAPHDIDLPHGARRARRGCGLRRVHARRGRGAPSPEPDDPHS